ncbi:hypothetical protein Plhal304r1_c055g0141441 [Plasmopara halstedii]
MYVAGVSIDYKHLGLRRMHLLFEVSSELNGSRNISEPYSPTLWDDYLGAKSFDERLWLVHDD